MATDRSAATRHPLVNGTREWAEAEVRSLEQSGNAKLANGLVIEARRYFRCADDYRRRYGL